MPTSLRWLARVLSAVVILCTSTDARAQADPQNYLFNSGQTIQPFFEGWAHNPDDTFEMHFGYLNRNYVEEIQVPIGPGNHMTPDGPDRGQPTYFYPRVNHRVFSVTIPAEWGERELVWEITVRDETYRAIGWLQAEWEIDPNPGAFFFAAAEGDAENQAPTLVVHADRALTLPDTLTLTATVTDDGLPEPRQRRRAPIVLPTFEPETDGPTLPVNVPQIQREVRRGPVRTSVEQVNVTWTQWRGPTGVTIAPRGESQDGVTTVTVTFETPGEYVFRVQASDRLETATQEISVIVR